MSANTLTLAEAARFMRDYFRTATEFVWIYAIQAGEGGPVKIGLAKDPDERLKTLQTANAAELRGLGAWRAMGRDEEKATHEMFAEHRIRGEWFEPAPELIEYVTFAGACFVWAGEPPYPWEEEADVA